MQQQTNAKQADEPVFTPLDATRSKRLRFKLADVVVLSGDLDVQGVGKKARVRIGSTVHDVFGAACDLPGCHCDAYIVPVRQQEQS
jgi:hypothetical protein